MTDRHIAILVDGGFFLNRLPKLVQPRFCNSPQTVVACLRRLCRTHVKALVGDDGANWHRHVYRIFYYDAVPYDGVGHHPLENKQIAFGKSNMANERRALFDLLKRQRNVALRLGKVTREGDWTITGANSRKVISTKAFMDSLDLSKLATDGTVSLDEDAV